jgi:shikimate 5-dehydrogenase
MLGAGGTGRAIGFALAQAGARKIGIFDLIWARAAVSKDIPLVFDMRGGVRGCRTARIDLDINATQSV